MIWSNVNQWRRAEPLIPHATWYVIAVAARELP